MYLNIVFLPLLGSIATGFFGRFLGGKGASLVSTFCVGLSFCLSGIVFYEVGLAGSACYIRLITWLDVDIFHADWGFCFDSLTVVILLVVTFVSTLVHLYSTEYIREDPHISRFLSYLSLFTFFILILVTADNFIQIFVGWEGVGLCSYLLINFWFTRIQANKAAIKAILVNRVGDFGLALGIFAIFYSFGAVDYSTVFALVPQFVDFTLCFILIEFNALTFICIFLFVGAIGKSAQLGLHTWLPDAMEGPTPVSALIHAATMVTAGVFLLVRCSPLLEFAPTVLSVISIIGALTAFFAATTAIVQNDLKRVIAYSTCSQLGYMVFACGLSNYSVAVFHLANHAFFKALLFLGAGSVIHAIGDEQDIRKIGGLRRILPFTYAIILIGSLSLIGIPFLTGFYSKDLILEVAYANYSLVSHFSYWCGVLAASCTAFYSIRLISLCFLSKPNGNRLILLSASESSWPIATSLGILAIPSIFIGYIGRDLFVGLGTNFWSNAIFNLPTTISALDFEFIPIFFKILPLFFSITAGILSFIFYIYYNHLLFSCKISFSGRKLYTFLNRKWFFDKVYNDIIGQKILNFGYHFTYKAIDRGLIESLGPYGLITVILGQVNKTRNWHSGILYHYSLVIIFGIFFLYESFQFISELKFNIFLIFVSLALF
ncbi:unnamed protein product [Choristocarpus tenellus]|uniref:NADH dehydrogenase subunit 5 n=1 Tax=Choristocarpus tenellus TaxID=116065 RepID=UPI002E776C6F|nr:NADH dehydrogenase subunit 5 [Choristocarpus tenellus]WBP69827.1 NADH dehydrogenase subunit 5 [Choristocarpus tenellus]